MANLNEYLGAIVTHLSQARVLADRESARIALAYADNDLLKHFPTPRMKFDSVELTIPVAVSEWEIAAARDVKPLNRESITALTHSEILASSGLRSLPAETSDSIRKDIAARVESMAVQINEDNSAQLFREYVSQVVEIVNRKLASLIERGVIKDPEVQKWHDITEKFRETLGQKLRSEITPGVSRPLGNLRVIVESDKLKERSPDTLITIKLRISEEAMEWERFKDDEGNTVNRLLPA